MPGVLSWMLGIWNKVKFTNIYTVSCPIISVASTGQDRGFGTWRHNVLTFWRSDFLASWIPGFLTSQLSQNIKTDARAHHPHSYLNHFISLCNLYIYLFDDLLVKHAMTKEGSFTVIWIVRRLWDNPSVLIFSLMTVICCRMVNQWVLTRYNQTVFYKRIARSTLLGQQRSLKKSNDSAGSRTRDLWIEVYLSIFINNRYRQSFIQPPFLHNVYGICNT